MIGMRRIRAKRNGQFQIRLEPPERELLRGLPTQAGVLMDTERDDPSLLRLFPNAYPDDKSANADYKNLVGEELFRHHRQALDILAETADLTEIDEPQLHQWLGALEVLRLVLGTQLDVDESDRRPPAGDPQSPRYAVYHYLGGLQSEVIDALAATLPAQSARSSD